MSLRTDRQILETHERDYQRTRHYKQFKFRTYRHEQFKKLREMFGIDRPEDDCNFIEGHHPAHIGPGESTLHDAMDAHKQGGRSAMRRREREGGGRERRSPRPLSGRPRVSTDTHAPPVN
jgi:hypothetical protein